MSTHPPEREIGETQVTPAMARGFACAALALLGTVTALEWDRAGLRAIAEFRVQVTPTPDDRALTWALQPNRELLAAMLAFEDRVEDEGWLASHLVGPAQALKLRHLRLGNENVLVGARDDLLFRPDLAHLAGPAFLDSGRLVRRSRTPTDGGTPVQPDPVRGVLAFARQLAARDITLVVVPTPVKPSVQDGMILRNPSFDAFREQLEAEGVRVFDPAFVLARESAPFLRTDTHWTPSAMESVARELAVFLRSNVGLPSASVAYAAREVEVAARGDLAGILSRGGAPLFAEERVVIREVDDGAFAWRADAASSVLLLGDSFSNIFSQDGLGWGGGAGFAEHLSFHLGLALDRMVRNDAGAHATREILSRELARGRDRLAGKRVVVWQFAARELSQGDWKALPLDLGARGSSDFLALSAGASLVVTGRVAAIAPVPVPGRVPYAEHIVAMRLTDVEGHPGRDAYVLAWSMTNHMRAAAGRFRAGDRVTLRLSPWGGLAADREAINRSELDDEELLLADPVWGDPAEETEARFP